MRRNHKFIDRSLINTFETLKESIFSDEISKRNGFLQSLDARLKIIFFIVLIFTVLFLKSFTVIFLFYCFCLALVLLSKIDLYFFLKRTWIFIPLFSFFIAIPAIFKFITPGETVYCFNLFGLNIEITRQGLNGAILFITRVATCVSFAILLSVTTRHLDLLKALRSFGVPQIFVMVLGMCYRYIYLFVELIENRYLAIKSRTGGRIDYKKGQRIVAWNMASLWNRSLQLNEAVYSAMLSRGYTGEPVTINEAKAKQKNHG